VYGGKLSCLEVTERNLFQISKGSRDVKKTNVRNHWELHEQLSL